MSPLLPIELYEKVVDCFENDITILTSLSLVCRAWRHRARRYIFAALSDDSEEQFMDFADLLEEDPTLGTYVRWLRLPAATSSNLVPKICTVERKSYSHVFLSILKGLPNLEFLGIAYRNLADESFDGHLMQEYSRLTSISLVGVYISESNILSLILVCPRLTNLGFEEVKLVDSASAELSQFQSGMHDSSIPRSAISPSMPVIRCIVYSHMGDMAELQPYSIMSLLSRIPLQLDINDLHLYCSSNIQVSNAAENAQELLETAGASLRNLRLSVIQLFWSPAWTGIDHIDIANNTEITTLHLTDCAMLLSPFGGASAAHAHRIMRLDWLAPMVRKINDSHTHLHTIRIDLRLTCVEDLTVKDGRLDWAKLDDALVSVVHRHQNMDIIFCMRMTEEPKTWAEPMTSMLLQCIPRLHEEIRVRAVCCRDWDPPPFGPINDDLHLGPYVSTLIPRAADPESEQ